MDKGWISLHRQIRDCELIWNDKPFSRGQAWIDLLLLANHEDKTILFDGSAIEVKRGQRVTSYRSLCASWGWSNSKVAKFLDMLETQQMIVKKSDTKKTLITIVNYDKYQLVEEKKRHRNDAETTLKRQNNNDNNENNENNINPPLPPFGGTGSEYDFDKHTNVENVKHVLNHKLYGKWEYIKANSELWEIIKDWMDYKDAKKPRSSNHYVNKRSICTLLDKFVSNTEKYGTAAVIDVVNDSISKTYQGITWDNLQTMKKGKTDWGKIR